MFNWLKRKKKGPPAYVDFYIILNGDHDVQIHGLKGIALKRVSREAYNKHKGLKYWISCSVLAKRRDPEDLKKLSNKARIDIFDLVYNRNLETFTGITNGQFC